MPALTRSKTGAAKIAVVESDPKPPPKRGATGKPKPRSKHKSTPKPVSKAKSPPKKRPRRQAPRVNKGSDTKMVFQPTVLPLELFLEIARYISPLDLIHLSRAARVFRSAFMSRSTADVWRATFANIGLPPCPDETMAEPRYAALMFLEQCTVSMNLLQGTLKKEESDKRPSRHVESRRLAISTPSTWLGYAMDVASAFLVPLYPRSKARRSEWFHREQYQKIVEKRDEFLKVGDEEGWNVWVDERKKFVETWYEKTRPLVTWVRDLELEYEEELQRLKEARKTEIESRLLKLGWYMADIHKASDYSNRWKASFNKTKLLDEEDWNKILPHLLEGLENARADRLHSEAFHRRSCRERLISRWFCSNPSISLHVNLCWKDKDNRVKSEAESVEASITSFHSEDTEKQDYTLEIKNYPAGLFGYWSSSTLRSYGQSYLADLLDQDKTMDEFCIEFKNKRGKIAEQLYKGWICKIQEDLIGTIPEDLVPVDVQNPNFYLQGHIGSGDTSIPDDPLSVNLRKLLRADVVIRIEQMSAHYSRGIDCWASEWGMGQYDPVLSKIAKALLHTLQHPNACYLEMRALGKVFLCGRCTREPQYHTWNDILDHYAREYRDHEHACRRNKRASESGREIEIVFRHDTDRIDDENPLVHVVPVTKQELVPIAGAIVSMSGCKLCVEIGHYYKTEATQITKHIKEVHLIEEPVLGEHYTEPTQYRV
ncbi:hypothetical protein RHS03_05695, partial [Rhizoctonia solani]